MQEVAQDSLNAHNDSHIVQHGYDSAGAKAEGMGYTPKRECDIDQDAQRRQADCIGRSSSDFFSNCRANAIKTLNDDLASGLFFHLWRGAR